MSHMQKINFRYVKPIKRNNLKTRKPLNKHLTAFEITENLLSLKAMGGGHRGKDNSFNSSF